MRLKVVSQTLFLGPFVVLLASVLANLAFPPVARGLMALGQASCSPRIRLDLVAAGLCVLVFGSLLAQRRFWCRGICPLGALLGLLGRWALRILGVGVGVGLAPAATADELVYLPGSTQRVCQLTGDIDRTTGRSTLNQTGKRFGAVATDLGSSFEHKGMLYFLFGDTWGQPGDRDLLAWTASTDPAALALEVHRGKDAQWLPLTVPGIGQGAFEIPSGGISIADTMYVVFTTDHSEARVMGRSVLASSHDDGLTFTLLYELSRQKFINVAFWLEDDWLYIIGSGEYRRSSVCLARVRPTDLANRAALQYFSGMGPDGQPAWSPEEAAAVVLFQHDEIGELSVAYLPPVKRYVMLYNAGSPRGITLRSAPQPWGPWSDGTVVFEPGRDRGYGHFMHVPPAPDGKGDTLSDPQRESEWGGEYGPYIMPRFTTGAAAECRIYYTMSTWNPYQVVVMQTDLKLVTAPQDHPR